MATDEAPPSASSPGRRWRRGVPACFPRSCGVASLAVRPRPRIGLLISGDELVSLYVALEVVGITVNFTYAATPGDCPSQTAEAHSEEVMASIGRLLRRAAVLQRRERRRGRRVQPRFRLSQIAVTSLGGLMAVGLLALLSAWSGHVLIVAPLGASSVLLFGYPRSPLAQPRNVVVGNTLGGFLGVALVSLFGQGPLVLALAVGLTILLGQQLRCLHPPAGGMAFLAAFFAMGWPFLLFPVLTGSVLLVLLAWGFSRWVPGAMPYPLHWL